MKTYYEKLNEDTPPFTHDLLLLTSSGGFYDNFSEEQKDFIRQLSSLNIRIRYPEYKNLIYKQLTQPVCKKILDQTIK